MNERGYELHVKQEEMIKDLQESMECYYEAKKMYDKNGINLFHHVNAVYKAVKRKSETEHIFEELAPVVAILHDVLEDEYMTREQLRVWLEEYYDKDSPLVELAFDAVVALTKVNVESIEEYLDYIISLKKNVVATFVKQFDLIDNLREILNPTEKDRTRAIKYRIALQILI